MATRGISFVLRAAALLSTVAVVFVALFLSGVGPFNTTRGPVSAFRALPSDAVDFSLITFPVSFALSLMMSRMRREHSAPLVGAYQPPPVLALRC